jgi:hypothetical protein
VLRTTVRRQFLVSEIRLAAPPRTYGDITGEAAHVLALIYGHQNRVIGVLFVQHDADLFGLI